MYLLKQKIVTWFVASRKLARLPIIVSCVGVALLGSVVAGEVTLSFSWTLIVIVLLIVHGNGTNDIADVDIDRVNLRNADDRPLVSGDATIRQLWWLQAFFGIFAIVTSLFISQVAALVTLAVVIYNYAYSFLPFRITDRTILSPLTLAAAYTFQPFTLGFESVGSSVSYPWLLVCAIYFGFVARLLLKDFRDTKGDARFGKKTFLLRYGILATCIASGVAALISLVLVGFAVKFSPGVFIVIVVGNLIVLWLLMRLAVTRTLKLQMTLIGLIAKLANISILTLLVYFSCFIYISIDPFFIQVLPLMIGVVFYIFISRGLYRAIRS